MSACVCPHLDPIETIPSGPVTCGCCGAPLQLTCAGACGEEHVRGAFASATAAHLAPVTAAARLEAPRREEAPRKRGPECPRCHRPMPTRRGRPARACPTCLTPAEQQRAKTRHVWDEQRRAKAEATS